MARKSINLTNPAIAPMVAWFTLSCAASRAHAALAGAGYAQHGQAGPLVSGCEQSHWPNPLKDQLRSLARLTGDYSDMARATRPKGMHSHTVNRIARAVATRDGTGRYGPQPE